MRGRALIFIGIILTVAMSLLYVRSRFLLVELSYSMSQKRVEKKRLEEERRGLTLELTTLKNPGRIEKLVKDRLGLGRSDTSVTVVSMNGEPHP